MVVNTYALSSNNLLRIAIRSDLPVKPGFQTPIANLIYPRVSEIALHNPDHLSLGRDQGFERTISVKGSQRLRSPGQRVTHSEVPEPNS